MQYNGRWLMVIAVRISLFGSSCHRDPVKAKLSSGIFHLPGGANYSRTHADRCYPSAAAAEADGRRASKR